MRPFRVEFFAFKMLNIKVSQNQYFICVQDRNLLHTSRQSVRLLEPDKEIKRKPDQQNTQYSRFICDVSRGCNGDFHSSSIYLHT